MPRARAESDVWNEAEKVSYRDSRLARRGAMAGIASAFLGVTAVDAFRADSSRGLADGPSPSTGTNIITLFMRGAMSHLDTFDPKPGREEQGETGVIQTKTPGVVFGESLPKLAGMSDRLAVIRAVTTQTGAHEQGQYLMRTGYQPINSIRHPAFGACALHCLGRRPGNLPGYVLVGNGNDHPGCGFLDPSLSPVPVADPQVGLENTVRPAYLTEQNFARRLALADRIDRDFKATYGGGQIEAYNQMYAEAVRLLGSDDLEAFDISRETEAVRDRYGRSQLGRGCLLARRLVESGVRVVEVDFNGWDMHRELFEELPTKAAILDKALGTLLDDLDDRGLLQSTLVVLATEFGRTPKINENGGRDHHPAVFSCLLAGSGVRGGVVHGASDERGHSPDSGVVSIADFNATVAAAAGLPSDKEFHAPNGRPFKIGGGGTAIREVLA